LVQSHLTIKGKYVQDNILILVHDDLVVSGDPDAVPTLTPRGN